jgi:hypothetical protein
MNFSIDGTVFIVAYIPTLRARMRAQLHPLAVIVSAFIRTQPSIPGSECARNCIR